jgi:hypothetical protein
MASTSSTSSNAINALMFDPGPSVYYTDGFRQVLEDHMTYLRQHQSTQVMAVSPRAAWENDQDLFGFLQLVNLQPQFHWVTMRMNNFSSPTEFGTSVTQLLIPSSVVLEQLRSAYMTSNVLTS